MVLFSTITSKLNRIIAPKLLKSSLFVRYVLSKNKPIITDNPYIDSFFLIPLAQTLISIEVQDVTSKRLKEEQDDKKKNSPLDDFVDRMWENYLERLSPPKPIDQHHQRLRLQVFNEYIRSVLIPNNVFHDINRWRFNHRFVKWLRSEYLICKYDSEIREILSSYTKLKHCTMLSQARNRSAGGKLRDTVKFGLSSDIILDDESNKYSIKYSKSLPTVQELNDAFGMHKWKKTKSINDEYNQMESVCKKLNGNMCNIPGTNINLSDVDEDTDVSNLTLEEILEVAGCHVSSCNAFNALCDDANIYEFWNQEYVNELSSYLIERCQCLHSKDGKDVIIVDVGAGDGILAHYLRENIITNRTAGQKKYGNKNQTKSKRKNSYIPTIVATDDGSWRIEPKANVERLSVDEALKKYSAAQNDGSIFNSNLHHLIVLCSWMPMGDDWTKLFRDANADEYILIGECDDGNCGHNWYTWGNVEFCEDNNGDETAEEIDITKKDLIPDYVLNGYKRSELEPLSKLQFSRFDSVVSSGSKTISFQKIDTF